MKKLFSITLFFWACTCSQQAQHIPSESSMHKDTIWSDNLLASGQKINHLILDVSYTLDFEAKKE